MSTAKTYKKLRLFVASPKDVAAECARLHTVVEELNRTGNLADWLGLTLELLDWRTHIAPLMGRPEEVVLRQLPVETWDIFVGILWLRFGTPSGAADPQTGKPFDSGTQEEFSLAYNSWKKNGRPKILFYRCTRVPASLDEIDHDQYKRVKDFFAQFDADAAHPGLPQSFQTAEEFERRVRADLTKLLLEYGKDVLNKEPPQSVVEYAAPKIPDNLPRRAAFFGRAKEMDVVMRALSPADRTWGVLVDGIGGIGKTALAVEAAYRCQDAGAFDAFVFITAKQNILMPSGIREQTPAARTLDDFLNETARVLGQPGITKLTGDDPLTGTGKRRALLDVLRAMRALLIYDNLETLSKEEQEAMADFLRELPQGCKAIITSRRRGGEGAVWLRVEKLDWDAARGIIENEMARDAGLANKLRRAESRWQELYDETNGSPLALVHTLGLMRVRVTLTFDGALEMLRGNRDADLQKFIFQEARKELTTNDATALGVLSFFVPSATFEAWMQVANLSRNALETTIDRLSALSLVDVLAGEERYALHPLTRAFVRDELLADANDARELGMRFARYWVDYAKQHGKDEAGNYEGFSQLETEISNLGTAINWLWAAVDVKNNTFWDKDVAKMLIDLAGGLEGFLRFSGRWAEHIRLNEQAYMGAYTMADWVNAGWRAYGLALIYSIHYGHSRIEDALTWASRCTETWAQIEGQEFVSLTRFINEVVDTKAQKYGYVGRLLQKVSSILSSPDTGIKDNIGLSNLGTLAYERKDYDATERYFREALEVVQKSDDKLAQSTYSYKFGILALDREQWTEAQKWFERALAFAREVGREDSIAQAQYGLARVHEAEGHADLALPLAQEALKIYERLQHRDSAAVRELVERLRGKA